MERDEADNYRALLNESDERPRSALNSTVLDYYRKFGRKRDLEQYFSLSTAQSEIRDPTSLFWRRMKEQSDTSDSGEKKSESSNEICRISIRCSIPEETRPRRDDSPTKTDSESPPIITEVVPGPSHSADESVDDNYSQKSMDGTMDTSMNKPLSPTSSVTSQRKLEWDSLADVGYGNESDRKTSASSLSTLEREVLAQKQQYTLDFKQNSNLGLPTAHSTPVDPNDKAKSKKGQGKKTMSFSKKDVDVVEFKLPHNVENAQAINVNLTKQFSVNLDRQGGFTVDNVKKDVSVSPEKDYGYAEVDSHPKMDKEIQTSLLRSEKKSRKNEKLSVKKVPVLICLNTLRRRRKRYKKRTLKTKIKNKQRLTGKKYAQQEQEKEKSGEQVSEAESFEYMPGHMYNQNQLNENLNVPSNNTVGNKSSLESSVAHTTDSSKESKYSLTKDLEKSLEILKSALKDKYDSNLKKKLVKDIIQRLLKSKYGDDESSPDFISVLSLSSKKTLTTSTSTDADNTIEKAVRPKPKKSILRVNKFDSNDIASTSQSAPNLPSVTNSEKPVLPYLPKPVSTTNTDTDLSANNSTKDNTSSDNIFAKTSSEELYKKYIDALKREEAYKLHLKDKELFLRQKLVRSNNTLKVPPQLDLKTNNKLKELIKDLTRNNYDDGSGDASKLECGSSSNFDINRPSIVRKQRSHSVFTLSSGNSDVNYHKSNLRDRDKQAAGKSGQCGHKKISTYTSNKKTYTKPNVTDSSVQVNLNSRDLQEQNRHVEFEANNTPKIAEDVKYVCLCTEKAGSSRSTPDEFLIYKCSRLTGRMPVVSTVSQACNTSIIPSSNNSPSDKNNIMAETSPPRDQDAITKKCCYREPVTCEDIPLSRKESKSSQTSVNVTLNTLHQPTASARSTGSSSTEEPRGNLTQRGIPKTDIGSNRSDNGSHSFKTKNCESCNIIQESTRCLQTEISIHPKVSDPTISDINIINSKDCVQLISELYRKISKSSSQNSRQNNTDKGDINADIIDSKSSKDSKRDNANQNENFSLADKDKITMTQLKDDKLAQPCGNCQRTPRTLPDTISENILIPIQGTKMTLKVSIASNEKSQHEPQAGTLTKTKTAQNKEVTEKQTSIATECSKGVQSENWCCNDMSKNMEPEMRDSNLDKNEDKQSLTSRTVDQRSNTYPKVLELKYRKPLLRSNTDTGDIGARSNITNANNIQDERKVPTISDYGSKKQPQSENDSETLAEINLSDKSRCSSTKQCNSDDKSEDTVSKSKMYCNMVTSDGTSRDMILDMIQDITKRYSKKDIERSKKKKCFQEIMTVINYLLDTDDSGEGEQDVAKESPKSNVSKRSNKNVKKFTEHNKNKNSPKKSEKCEACSPKTKVKIYNTQDLNKRGENPKKSQIKTTKDSSCGSDEILTKDIPDDTKIKRSIELTTDSDSSKYGRKVSSAQTSISESLKNQERSDNTEYKTDTKMQRKIDKVQTTHDKCCGSDNSLGSKGSSERDDKSYENRKETPEKRKKEATQNIDVFTQQKQQQQPKDIIDKVDKKHRFSKQQSIEMDAPKTCDKSCGCDESSECINSCGDTGKTDKQQQPKDMIDKVDKKHRFSKQQSIDEDTPKTCDKSCECDESSECMDSCGDTGKTDKQSHQKPSKRLVSKCVQSTARKVKSMCSQINDSSDVFISTDQPSCSTSSPTARIINKIKKECEKYQKRSKSHCCKKNEQSSSTSNCDHCMRVPPCHCKGHKCRGHRTKTSMEKIKKKCLAYNLILQTSDSIISDDNAFDKHYQKLQNIVIKVPKRRQENVPFKEMAEKIERKMSCCSPRYYPKNRSRSWPNESGISSTDDVKMAQAYTVRDYLEQNRPDFVERCAHRQNCIRMISESRAETHGYPPMKMIVVHTPNCNGACSGPTTMYCGGVPTNFDCNNPCAQTVENEVTRVASQRSQQREVLSMQLENLPTLTEDDMLYLAQELGIGRRSSSSRPDHSKIISEREMKKHSEKIYKSLPEVVRKKEEAKKQSIKKTNLLMASIFKRNLQKKTLRGAVNLSNYSAVIKI